MHRALASAAAVFLLALPRAASSVELHLTSAATTDQLIELGDNLFRQSNFEEAESAYAQALRIDPRSARGHLGMGKIANLHFEHRRAAQHYSAAYQAEPRNPEAVLAFASVVDDRTAKETLLRNFLILSSTNSEENRRREDVKARLRIEDRLGSRAVSALKSQYRFYQLPLTNRPGGGLLLRVKVNGGRDLRLIVDTGASGIVLNASAQRDCTLEVLTPAVLAGFGSSAPAPAHMALAETLESGDFALSNVMVTLSAADLTREADGVIGLDVFRDFQIQLDARARTLQLTPFSAASETADCRNCVRAHQVGNLLLIRGTVNGNRHGYFILDSGSPYTIISSGLMPTSGHTTLAAGAQGAQQVTFSNVPVHLRIGTQRLLDSEYALLDTSEISARNGTEIIGAIGFSMLRGMRLSLDYQHGLVGFDKAAR